MDAACELSGSLKAAASALLKIADDLRWMNSGPGAGLSEIALPGLQPGSSIMPGKVNPVIPESAMMAAAQILGNDLTITLCHGRGNFQLNTMLPALAYNLLQSIALLGNASRLLAEKAVAGFVVHRERMAEQAGRNPILATALNPILGYDRAAAIAKRAFAEGRDVKEVAAEMAGLEKERLDQLLDPKRLAQGG
jgi:fumarate hydratase class II